MERGWLSSNNVLLLGHEQAAMVDSGYVSHSEQTLALVERVLAGRELDVLVNTHLHSDHCGGNAALQSRYPGLRTHIPPGEAVAVRDWDEGNLSYRATGQECPRFSFDSILIAGETIRLGDRDWEVHSAPGHDPHAVLLFEPASKLLISGDALWEKGFGIVFPEMWGEPSFEEVASTLDVIESLAPSCVIPGHGAIFSDVGLALTVARDRLNGFVRAPTRHARHAIKVLIKFKLLDSGQMHHSDLQTWLETAAYMETVRARFAPERSMHDWSDELIAELTHSGALRRDGDLLFN